MSAPSSTQLIRCAGHLGRGKATPLRNTHVRAGLSRARREATAFGLFVVAGGSTRRMRRFVAYSLETGQLYGGTL